jgi:hypothetical protein
VRPPKLALRMAAGAIAVAATMALGVAGAAAAPNPGPGTAGGTGDGPQTANVPVLAWAGEKVRLVACDPAIAPSGRTASPTESAYFNTELWTGDQAYQSTPVFDGSAQNTLTLTSASNNFFAPTNPENAGKGCVEADITSLHAGLWEGEVDVFDGVNPITGSDNVYSEQFIVIWMTANAPTLSEASVSTQGTNINSLANPGSPGTDAPPTTFSQLSPLGLINATNYLGDPTGNGMFTPDWFGFGGPTGCNSHGPISLDGQSNINDSGNYDDPGCNNGLVDVRVTGSFPIEDQPPATTNAQYFGATSFTLPRDWKKLAGILADSSTRGSNPGSNPGLWDIHGGPTNTLTHVGFSTPPNQSVCINDIGSVFSTHTPAFLETFDAVDNCTGLTNIFSRVFGDLTSGVTATVGPYDDEFPNETLISDGMLNSDDAPMPALPVTVSIAGNTGGTDIGGVGGLFSASKQLIYSHDFTGLPLRSVPSVSTQAPNTPGNLYNPYYKEYIPSTERTSNGGPSGEYPEASGIDGVYNGGFAGSSGDNFPGFSNGDTAPYTFWHAEDVGTVDNRGATACLQRTWDPIQGTPPKWYQLSSYYQNPYYPTSVTVYTDERGEAYVTYNPGNEFYFNNLIASGKIGVDNNGACDLQPLLGKSLGTSVISAQASYPYKAVPYKAPLSSNSLTKTVTSEWNKTLTAYPKLNAGAGTYSADDSIFVAKATDIGGEPFVGETVCFSVQATQALPGVNVFIGQVENTAHAVLADTGKGMYPWQISSFPASEPVGASNYTCATTNYLGEAGIEISGSIPSVDVTAWFVNEHLFRDVSTTLGDPIPVTSSSSPTTLPADPIVLPTGTSGGSGGSSSASNAVTSSVGTSSVVTIVTPLAVAKATTVEFARLVRGKKGDSVTLDVSSAKKTQAVTIKVYAHGKLIRTYHVTVKTNKLVKVNIGHGTIGRIKVIL